VWQGTQGIQQVHAVHIWQAKVLNHQADGLARQMLDRAARVAGDEHAVAACLECHAK
jgi:hypothetical protein